MITCEKEDADNYCEFTTEETDKVLYTTRNDAIFSSTNNRIFLAFSLIITAMGLCILVSVLVVSLLNTYAAVKVETEYRPGPQPRPFFSCNSSVIDLHQGDLDPIIDHFACGEVLFVMYYAPWSFDCLQFRPYFEILASYFSSQITFYGVNCWEPVGQCRRLRQPREFPIFELYFHKPRQSIEYSGLLSLDYMFKFLEHAIDPFVRLATEEELNEFLSRLTNRVIGYYAFDEHRNPPEYEKFYLICLRSLEMDPIRKLAEFAVITDKSLAARVNLTTNAQLCFFTSISNTCQIYPDNEHFSVETVLKWISGQLKVVNFWFIPNQKKSNALRSVLKRPSFLLLTPWQLLIEQSTIASLFPPLAAMYFDCKKDESIKERFEKVASSLGLESDAVENYHAKCIGEDASRKKVYQDAYWKHSSLLKADSGFLNTGRSGEEITSCDRQNSFKPVMQFCKKPQYIYSGGGGGDCSVGEDLEKAEFIKNSHDAGSNFPNFPHSNAECLKNIFRAVELDPFLDDSLCRRWSLSFALKYTFALPVEKALVQMWSENSTFSSYRGLACKTKSILNFLTIDSDYFNWYADKLGLPENVRSPKIPKAMIIDATKNAFYVLKENVTAKSIVQFVQNFTNGQLNRFYKSEKESETKSKQSSEKNRLNLVKVTTNSFSELVLASNKNVVLFYYTRWCVFCHTVMHIISTAAYIMRFSKKVEFAQIDAGRNDLPVDHAVSHYPSVVLYPCLAKNNRTIYPSKVPFTVTNLISFVMHHSDRMTRLELGVKFCSAKCRHRNLNLLHKQLSSYRRRLMHISDIVVSKQLIGNSDNRQSVFCMKSYWKKLSHFQLKRRELVKLRGLICSVFQQFVFMNR
ncbi:Thioredoxin domain-containing protein 11 [Trichinella papuae]|uniref:Thioredoxin domain-containing protein 11 n=1 Tax=Trichinella papuae TaxID=268474 RepID=A0A0V1N877_9BILA|nr:Thioredoxin domain-containing protein 11 [Trichinella papuae]